MTEININTAESPRELIALEEGLFLLKINQLEESTNYFWNELHTDYIQFHFGLKGKSQVNFNNKTYAMPLKEEEVLLIYNPNQPLPLDVEVEKDACMISIFVKIELFHSFFSEVSNHIPFLNDENSHKKYYDSSEASPEAVVVLNQISKLRFQDHLQHLYLKGKTYELISIYFNKSEQTDLESCPFLIDEFYLSKVKRVKDIIVERMIDPPSLNELSEEVGLNLKKLKLGFKQVYGSSVFNFLFDYKMEYSRKLLESGNYNINEVGEKIGYSSASHFIASFKKKYGVTPKKYVQSHNGIRL